MDRRVSLSLGWLLKHRIGMPVQLLSEYDEETRMSAIEARSEGMRKAEASVFYGLRWVVELQS